MADETNPAAALSYNKEEQVLDSDAPVIVRVQQGDVDAFEQLVVKHQKRLLNIAMRILNDYDEACECVQDAFVAAFRAIKTFRREAKFSTWLISITLNHARNRLKQLKTRSGRIAFSINDAVENETGKIAIDLPSHEPSALEQLQQRDVQARVRDCIDALDQEYREVIVLRDVQDLSYDEIGAALGIREGTVKSRLFRARDAVKDCLKKVWGSL